MNYIVFDIETYSPTNNPRIVTSELKTSVTGAYFSWLDKYVAFIEDDCKDFIDTMRKADLIVGFNHLWFDLPVLQKYSSYNLKDLPVYDIMLEFEKKIGFKIKLDDLCKANLGQQKTDSYENFKHYYEDKNWEPLIDYCMHDVRLTHELFKICLAGKPIKYIDLLDTKQVTLDIPKSGKMHLVEDLESIF
jgi:predicted PolB exonuclease-like 3'-5' exonuclease